MILIYPVSLVRLGGETGPAACKHSLQLIRMTDVGDDEGVMRQHLYPPEETFPGHPVIRFGIQGPQGEPFQGIRGEGREVCREGDFA